MQNNVNTPTTEKTKGNGNGKWMTKAADEVSEQASHLSESAQQIYSQAVESGSDMLAKANKRATAVVKEYPIQATVGGIIFGFLLGASLFRRRS